MTKPALELHLISKTVPGVGTFGELYHQGRLLLVTVERDWRNNEPNVSCVPAGLYTLRRHTSPSKGACFALEAPSLGVTISGPSQRTHCLVHVANFPHQLAGCIGPGLDWHPTRWGVSNSEAALDKLDRLFTDHGVTEARLRIVRH